MVRIEADIIKGEANIVCGRMKMEWIMRIIACRQCTRAVVISQYASRREGH